MGECRQKSARVGPRRVSNAERINLQFLYSARASNIDVVVDINPLNAEINPICHLLALLEDRHILHVSRIRVKNDGW